MDVTALLHAWSDGDEGAREALIPIVYEELRGRAAALIRREPRGQSLEPAGLVHEVYLKLVDQRRAAWQNRAQFFAVASQLMRRVLVDRARARRTAKRSGRWARVTLDDHLRPDGPAQVDVLDLDRALTRLSAIDPRKSQLAELRFFTGLSLPEASAVLEISVATAERDWQVARAWLFRELRGAEDSARAVKKRR